jgi:two-component system NtrC family response regulator
LDNAALIVCPDTSERAAYSGWLRSEGYRVVESASSAEAIAQHHRRSFPLTLAELASPTIDGVELIRAVRTINPLAELLMVSNGDSVHDAIAAIKAGAVDLLLKPIDRETLLGSIRQIGGLHEVLQENRRLREELHRHYDFSRIIAHSPQMLHVLSLAGRVAPRDTSVLITGESGTGKELLARAIHVNSARSHRPLVSINCAAIPEPLIESELFGYKRGAFTGAQTDKPGLLSTAAGGTLFLDEIAELPLATQAKLLRFLQEGTYFQLGGLQPLSADLRVIAATNAPLRERVEAGGFRRDLYYRLSVFPLHIPPLRERVQDIIPLAQHFLSGFGSEFGKKVPGLSREAAAYIASRRWPGNVRELQNAIERAVIVSAGNLLTSADFRTLHPDLEPTDELSNGLWQLPPEGLDLADLNRRLVVAALERERYNMSGAARLLGLSRPAMRYRMKKYGLAG